MIVRRVEVEGGFLDGFDQALEPGLVTVIGSRGTGKTSLIELIRFGLDAGRLTKSTDPYKHAKSILDSGQVALTVEVAGEEIRVVRGALDPTPRGMELLNGTLPLILAQNEIEELGKERSGQLNLIDGFRGSRSADESEQARLGDIVRSATAQIREIGSELANLRDQLGQLGDLVAAREEAKALETKLSAGTAQTSPIRAQLDTLTARLSEAKVENGLLRRNLEVAQRWLVDLQSSAAREPQMHPIGSSAAYSGLEERVEEARVALDKAISRLAQGIASVELALSEGTNGEAALESQARELRRQLDELEEGAGSMARAISELRQKEAFAASMQALIAQHESDLLTKQEARAELITGLDELRDRRYEQRKAIVAMLNSKLQPKISISLTRSGNFEAYSDLLIALLRGSNLRYNTLAPMLASQLSPVELALLVEAGDSAQLAEAAGLDPDRAARVLGYLGLAGTEDLLTAPVEDSVDISLLDGAQYKTSEELSTGQRCTAVLPILLSQPERSLIIDQPEDHLDNAFVVETVIKALRDRKRDVQFLFSTHNANIPVLGEADQVIALDSSGQRGFVKEAGSLDDDAIVAIITAVMEGGAEAFRQRAAFYSAHTPDG